MNKTEFALALGKAKYHYKDSIMAITLYNSPSDEQGYYVARLFVTIDNKPVPLNVSFKSKDIKEVKAAIPDEYFIWTERHPNDDPIIMGTWI